MKRLDGRYSGALHQAAAAGGRHFGLGGGSSLRVDDRRRDSIDFICTSDQPNEAASNLNNNKK